MSSHHSATVGTDDYTVRQENELEALASIFGDDFQDLRNSHTWKVAAHVSRALLLSMMGKSYQITPLNMK